MHKGRSAQSNSPHTAGIPIRPSTWNTGHLRQPRWAVNESGGGPRAGGAAAQHGAPRRGALAVVCVLRRGVGHQRRRAGTPPQRSGGDLRNVSKTVGAVHGRVPSCRSPKVLAPAWPQGPGAVRTFAEVARNTYSWSNVHIQFRDNLRVYSQCVFCARLFRYRPSTVVSRL